MIPNAINSAFSLKAIKARIKGFDYNLEEERGRRELWKEREMRECRHELSGQRQKWRERERKNDKKIEVQRRPCQRAAAATGGSSSSP